MSTGLTNGGNGSIIKAGSGRVSKPTIDKPIGMPIEQRHTGKGNPNAILHYDRPLNKRQQELIDVLSEYDSRATVRKNNVSMSDLSALTAMTGDEFAMFTKGKERLIIRGNAYKVNITIDDARLLAKEGYKWSGHTHPGTDWNSLISSKGDKEILKCFEQSQSVVHNSKGQFLRFGKD